MKLYFLVLVILNFSPLAQADVNVWAQFEGVYKVSSVSENGAVQSPHTIKIIVGGVNDQWSLTWWNSPPLGTATQALYLGQDPSKYCSNPAKSCTLQTSAELNPGKISHRYYRSYEGIIYEDQTLTFEANGNGTFEMIEIWKSDSTVTRVYTLEKE